MKRTKASLVALLLATIAGFPGLLGAEPPGRNLFAVPQKMQLVSLEKLEAEFYSASRVVGIKGSIKNTSNSSLRGYLTLYLLSVGGDVLGAFELPVNDHRPFRNGESVPFDTAINVSHISGAYTVSVDFTRE